MDTPNEKQSKENKCSDTWTCFRELEDLPWQQSSLGEYRQLSLWKSTPTRETSCDRISQEYQFTQTSETTIQSQESLKSSQWDGRVREHQTQELKRDSSIQPHHSGEKDKVLPVPGPPVRIITFSLAAISTATYCWGDSSI